MMMFVKVNDEEHCFPTAGFLGSQTSFGITQTKRN